VMWNDLTVVSQEVEYSPSDPLVNWYHFIHPSDSSVTMDWYVKLVKKSPIPGAGPVMEAEITYEPRYAGDLLARRVRRSALEFVWQNPHSDTQVGPSWTDIAHPTLWTQQTFRCGAANWADQPEYHPYRH